MFQLKEYQQKTLDKLEEYLKQARFFGAKIAFNELTNNKSEYKAIKTLEETPYICLRLPTGGGKTFLSAHSIGIASKSYLEQDFPVVLWLVPSTIIKEQTVETLKNLNHPNRQVLENSFGGNVAIFDITDFANVRPQDLKSKACVFVSTFQSFRVENKEGRKIYEHNENLETHFTYIPINSALNFDRIENGADKGKIKFSFANLLNILHPLVIVDEAHNNTTNLSYEVMNRVNPSCIIEFTATPAKESNVLHRVCAMEVKSEEMIKLPIVLTEYPSWQEALEASILKRKDLDNIAKSDKDYIRPIVLIQAESRDREVTVEIIKNYLIENGKISPEKIAIATGEQRELDGINILSPDCPIEFVITMQALKEGWDCPFAYIFCSTATVNSKTAVEQLLGRVLRMPYAKAREQQDLNKAYAFVSTTSWPNAVSKMCDNLTNMGFDEKEAENSLEPELQQMNLEFNFENHRPIKYTFVSKIDITKLSEETKQILELEALEGGTTSVKIGYDASENVILELKNAVDKKDISALEKTVSVLKNVVIKKFPSEKGEIIEVPQLKLFVDGKWELAEKEMFLPNGWNLLDFPAILDTNEFCIRDDGRTVEIDIEGKRIVERFYQNTLSLNIENVETNWSNSDLSRWIDRKMYQPDITMPVKLEFVRRIVEYLILRRGISLSTLIMRKFLLLKAVENKINGCRKKAYAKGYQTSLFKNSKNVKTDFDYKFKFDKYYPAREKYAGRKRFNKHFYPIVADMNGEEAECAAIMDSLPEIKYWVRNVEHHTIAFSLPTSCDKFYPDFVALLNDGRLYVIEYKGGDRVSNDDSKEKDNIGKLWAEKSSGQCLFKMVTDEKTAGKSILNQIKEEL